MKKKNSLKSLLLCIFLLIGCCIVLFIKYNPFHSEEIVIAEEINLEDDEPYFPDEEDDRNLSNVIKNPGYFDTLLDAKIPAKNLQTLPTEVDNYLQSMNYYNEDLIIQEGGVHRSGTWMNYIFDIGETGDVLYCNYEINLQEYEFYIEKQ